MNSHPRGLTLVEILAAMVVLVIGVTVVTFMLITGAKFSRAALEQNTASMMIAEAVPEIERRHLVTNVMQLKNLSNFNPPASEVGLFIETLDDPNGPDIHDTGYTDVKIGATPIHGDAFKLKCFDGLLPAQIHMSMWPMPTESPKSYGSLQDLRPGDNSPHGTPLRVLYRLERHPDWQPHSIDASGSVNYPSVENTGSPHRGVYVLTMTIYKDFKRDGSALEQVSDPYVVYLNDKKVR